MMQKQYDPKEIEKKWQDKWDADQTYRATEDTTKKKFYALVEFPYPSADGLHLGHPRSYCGMDIVARKRRMQGYSVLYPMGWDAFGLPAENYAINTGKQPALITKDNSNTFRRQIKSLGISFDWSREVNTTDPKYYKWTQWIFLKMLRAGLAYKAKMPINWCPKCKIGLANEEAVGGVCERCGGPTEKREKEQWMLAITKYAERLHRDLDDVNYKDRIKIQQRNWIGRSEGHEFSFKVKGASDKEIKVFTTRIDTLFGATYVVLAPEHELIAKLSSQIENFDEVSIYIEEAKKKRDIDRTAEDKNKTGVDLKGVKVINPANGEEIPVWVADYVLGSYGTGAVMAVPAHDDRDFAFAKKYNLPIKQVIAAEFGIKRDNEERRDGGGGYVFDPKTQKYAFLRSKWGLGIFGGGVDKNEDLQEGVTREVTEESGLYDFKYVERVVTAFAHYRNTLRKVNRFTSSTAFLYILDSAKTKEVKHEDHEDFTLDWATAEEVMKNWEGRENRADIDHWFFQLKNAVGRAIELGYDTTSDPKKFFTSAFTEYGIVINSGEFDELSSEEAKDKIAEKVGAEKKITYKLRDWVFSRQRYWGEPIPVVYCPLDGIVPLDESELPLTLPPVEKYQPTDTGESPLAQVEEWVNTICPACGGPAKRETDTMPNWAGSSWYYIAYCVRGISNFQFPIFKDDNSKQTREKLDYWLPVDWYNGGMEHTTLHLLYSRFWHKFLFDQGVVPTSEPYQKRTSHGFILASDGEKMSKSRGNVINPDEIVKQFGADSFRLYQAFMGPFDQAIAWNSDSLAGVYRFIERVWNLKEKVKGESTKGKVNSELEILLNQTVKKVGEDIEELKFNTAVSSLMILVNKMGEEESLSKEMYEILVKMMAVFTPHLAEELWSNMGYTSTVHQETWPAHDETKLQSNTVKLAIQVGGKLRGVIEADRGISESEAINKAYSDPNIKKWLTDGPPKKTVFVPDRLLNIMP